MLHEVTNRTDVPAAADRMAQSAAQRRNEIEQGTTKSPSIDQSAKTESGDLQQAVARVREEFVKVEPRLQFEIDRDLNRVIVKIMDGDSGEVIRQIPAKEVLDLAKSLDASKGFLLKQQA